MSIRVMSAVSLVAAAFLVTACGGGLPVSTPTSSASPTHSGTESPTPTATPTLTPPATAAPAPDANPTPPVGELVLSATGLGPLLLGMPAASSPMIMLELQTCIDDGPTFESWESTYPDSPDVHGNPAPPFVVGTITADTVEVITVLDPQIRTTGGTRLGDTLEQFLAAHPEAVEGESREPWRRFLIVGAAGTVVVDVAVASDPAYWGEFEGRVVGLNAVVATRSIGSPGFHGMNPSPCT